MGTVQNYKVREKHSILSCTIMTIVRRRKRTIAKDWIKSCDFFIVDNEKAMTLRMFIFEFRALANVIFV